MLAQINRTRPDEIAEEPNMHEVTESEKDAFFEEVAKASATAVGTLH